MSWVQFTALCLRLPMFRARALYVALFGVLQGVRQAFGDEDATQRARDLYALAYPSSEVAMPAIAPNALRQAPEPPAA